MATNKKKNTDNGGASKGHILLSVFRIFFVSRKSLSKNQVQAECVNPDKSMQTSQANLG